MMMISPVRIIPDREAWALTPESTAQTTASLADYKAGRTIGVRALDALIAAQGRKKSRKAALP
jgi:hypothetical protein